MQGQMYSSTGGTNNLALISLLIGIISWLLFIILLCLNYVILPLFTVATMGAGAIFYVCTFAAGCLSPVGWLIGTILGYSAKNQIKQLPIGNHNTANTGFIINVAGLGLTILGVCAIALLAVATGGFEFLNQMQQY